MKKILLTTLTIALILVFFTVVFAGCAKHRDVYPVEFERGNFAKKINPADLTFGDESRMEVDATIANGSDKLAAILHLMEVAEHNYYYTDYIARVSLGGGEATANISAKLSLEGKMAVRSFYIKEPNRKYDQNIGAVYEGEPGYLLGPAQMLLDQGKRSYTINTGTVDQINYVQEPKNKGNPTMVKDVFPYATLNFNKAKVETRPYSAPDPNAEVEWLKRSGELTNYVISNQSIKANSYSVEYSSSLGLYTATFEIDLDTQAKRDAYSAKPRIGLRKSASSDDLEIIKHEITLEIYDNGLIRRYITSENWEGTLDILGPKFGTSDSTNIDYYSWDPQDASIDLYVEEGIIDLDWIPAA